MLEAAIDALLCPPGQVRAWPLGSLGPSGIGGLLAGPYGHVAFTPLFNGGVPAIPLPCGGQQGLSVGLQIAAWRSPMHGCCGWQGVQNKYWARRPRHRWRRRIEPGPSPRSEKARTALA